MEIRGYPVDGGDKILTPGALAFVEELHERFAGRRDELLARRRTVRDEVARTGKLDFLADTAGIRDDDTWRVAPAPPALTRRHVEITGPTERKMTINALNSGADVWLADLEDANTPHWSNVVGGQVNLYDAVRREITHTAPDGRRYELAGGPTPTIVVRPRGWHLPERHLGQGAVGALVDFGLYFFHNAQELLDRGAGPYFYLPKMESHLEALLWNDVFTYAQERLDIPQGTIRATVLIETIPAAFQMDEILYQLREHASGLNAGRWDYLFSIIKYFRDAGPDFVLPDRNKVAMTAPCMRAYTDLLVRTCHRRGAYAMGGMAALIPTRKDPAVNEIAFAKVRADKQREAGDGFDGSWVAHPDLVPLCREVFGETLGDRPHQLDRLRPEVSVSAADLLNIKDTPGRITLDGLRANISVGVRYIDSWLRGVGAAAIFNLMEDAATAEISRSQVWQWIRAGVVLDNSGDPVTADLVRRLGDQEFGDGYAEARALFEKVALTEEYPDFLTLPAYELID